ncbi:glycosyltransferase [Arthrobacter sp. GAS37]|uniref:glycosyltransferase n=1 Tax=Arthrobacter sp. GAS37 TaxID=3156261 RepID=UPI00384F4371
MNRVLGEEGEELISADMRELLLRGGIIIPSIPEFDQVPPAFPAQTHHVGPLDVPVPSVTQADNASRSRIFFYRTVGANRSLPAFKRVFEEFGDRVYIATGSPDGARLLKNELADTDFNIAPYWNKDEIYPNAAIAVHHGGPGTVLDCMATGTPSIVLPGSSPERCFYGKKVQDLGIGVTVDANPSLTGNWHTAADSVDTTDWTHVGELARQLFQDGHVRDNCRRLRERVARSEYESIATVIENLRPYGDNRMPDPAFSAGDRGPL